MLVPITRKAAHRTDCELTQDLGYTTCASAAYEKAVIELLHLVMHQGVLY